MGGRTALLSGGEEANVVLEPWHDGDPFDLLVVRDAASSRARAALSQYNPAVVIATGRSIVDGRPLIPNGATLLELGRTSGLELRARSGRIAVSYRDR
jgi:hypothetical protein